MIEQALRLADLVLIPIGSANVPRRHDYVPFTAQERETMIRLMFSAEDNARLRFVYVEDRGNMAEWSSAVRTAAHAIEADDKKISLIGHSKDNSSYYLKGFPGWDTSDVDNYMGLSATTFRQQFFSTDFRVATTLTPAWADGIDYHVRDWMIDEFMKNKAYDHLVEEAVKCAEDVEKYGRIDPETGKKVYGPYFAADFICVQAGHVLVIERGGHPYKGCIAFPGGFIHDDEDVVEAAIREGKREETGMKVPELVLRSSYVTTQWFSAPHRDPRGRVVSASSLFHLKPVPPALMTDPKEIAKFLALPRVKAGDDAKRAFWMSTDKVKSAIMAFDHAIQWNRMLPFLRD